MSWTVLPEWLDDTAFIIACGPSLANVPVEKIRGKGRVIAINDSFIKAPWADVLYFCDKRTFWDEYESQIKAIFRGKYIVTLDNKIEGVKSLKNTGPNGLETDPGGLRTGSNSGYQAINLAYHFGATRIVLIGYDMSCRGHSIHWRERRRLQTVHGYTQTIDNHMLPNFPTLVEPLKRAGVAVINATPNSRLRVWPYMPLYDVVKNLRNVQFWKERELLPETVSVRKE